MIEPELYRIAVLYRSRPGDVPMPMFPLRVGDVLVARPQYLSDVHAVLLVDGYSDDDIRRATGLKCVALRHQRASPDERTTTLIYSLPLQRLSLAHNQSLNQFFHPTSDPPMFNTLTHLRRTSISWRLVA